MTCIPSVLVRTDWPAIAAWSGVVVNGAVVAVAFMVQRRQARADRALADASLRRIVDQGCAVVVDANTHLRIVGDWLKERDISGATQQVERLDRERRIVEHYLSRDLPSAQLVGLLIEARTDLDWLSGRVQAIVAKLKDDRALFPEMDQDILIMEVRLRDLDWMIRIGAAQGIQQTWK